MTNDRKLLGELIFGLILAGTFMYFVLKGTKSREEMRKHLRYNGYNERQIDSIMKTKDSDYGAWLLMG